MRTPAQRLPQRPWRHPHNFSPFPSFSIPLSLPSSLLLLLVHPQCRLKVAGGPGPHFGWGPRPGPHFQTISLPFPSRSSPSHGPTLPSFPFPSLPSPSQASLPFQFPSLLFSPPLFPSPSLRSRLPVLSQLGGLGERGRKRKT